MIAPTLPDYFHRRRYAAQARTDSKGDFNDERKR